MRKAGVHPKKAKAARFAQRVKLGQNGLSIHTLQRMRTSPQVSIAKIQITQKSLKAAKEKVDRWVS
jgi:cytochrome c5